MIRNYALGAACALFVNIAAGVSTANAAANPLGIAFKTTQNAGLYAKPTGMLITGRCNVSDAQFVNARKKGAEVLQYFAPVERPNKPVCALDTKFYMNNINAVPLWPYPKYGTRVKWPNTKMSDMRPGSKWILHVVAQIEQVMREGKVDGVFLDSVGARPWNALAQWSTWSTTEKNAWTAGNVDLVRRLDEKRRKINPNFLIINNNVWDRGDGNTAGFAGEKYVDGVMLEHPKGGSAWHKKYVTKKFGNLGQRRVLIIANNKSEAQAWAKVPGVTHVSDQTTPQYTHPTPPPVGFSYLGDRK